MTRDPEHALSFGKAVGDYDRGRPGYPDAALDWILGQVSASPRIVDVGAGTGKLTAALASRGLAVTAVEPDAGMLARLAENVPAATALAGSAESIPLGPASADLVTFAQSWHWVDVPVASAEVARVLAPGGALALLWNTRDESAHWVAQLSAVIGSSEAEQFDSLTPPVAAPLRRTGFASFAWESPMTRDQLLAMIASRSYVITMRPEERETMFARVDELLDGHPDLAGRNQFLMPYTTRVTIVRAEAS